jgi:tetratricopeptide (TPR) repeat protein
VARAGFHRTLRVLSVGFALVAAGCAARPERRAEPAPRTVARAKQAEPDARQKLAALLRRVERPGPVLEAVPEQQRAALAKKLEGLAASERAEVQSGAGGLAELLPLLHLAAGGQSPHALFALAAGPRAAEGLLGSIGTASRIETVREVARRAALHFLRDRTFELGSPDTTTPALCRAIDQVAAALGDREIARAARELWGELEPVPAVWLRVAEVRALALDVEGARAALARAGGAHGVERVSRLIEAAALVGSAREARPGLEPALERARAELALERWQEALALLAPFREQAEGHLGLAAALALAETQGSVCPGLARGLGTPGLCAAAWNEDQTVKLALQRLERAFGERSGRDDVSLEVYIGYTQIVPWIHATSSLGFVDAESAARALAPRLAALRSALGEAPRLSHIRVFVDALALGYAAGGRGHSGKSERDALRKSALGESAAVARLAAAAVLSPEQDVSELVVSSTAEGLTRAERRARAGLLAWVASSARHAEIVEPARAALADLVAELGDDELARAETVLLLAEFDAARDPSSKHQTVLSKVSSELISGAVPPELGLRAVLGAATSLVAAGRKDEARRFLEQAQDIAPLPGPSLDLLALIRGYSILLKAEIAPASELASLQHELVAMSGPDAPPSIEFVFTRWLARFEVEARCKKDKGRDCSGRARARLSTLPKHLASRLAPDTVELFDKSGVLRTARAGLRLSYAPETGIEPEVTFVPSFLKMDAP